MKLQSTKSQVGIFLGFNAVFTIAGLYYYHSTLDGLKYLHVKKSFLK